MARRPTPEQIKEALAVIDFHIREIEAELQRVVNDMEAAYSRYKSLETEKSSLEKRLEKLQVLRRGFVKVVGDELGVDLSELESL